jgi:hypothetical protein
MKENYLDIAEQILRYKSHRDPLIRKMVITMIPSLAAYDTQTFTEHFLHKAMGHLLTQLEKLAERNYGMDSSFLVGTASVLNLQHQRSLPLGTPLMLLGVT